MSDDGHYHYLGWRRIYRDPDGMAHFERIDDGNDTLSFPAAERTRVILDAMVACNAERTACVTKAQADAALAAYAKRIQDVLAWDKLSAEVAERRWPVNTGSPKT